MKISPPNPDPIRGFTLLEVVLALLLLTLLVGMVFGTASSSLALGNTVVETQNKEMHQQAFFELLSNRFAALPGNTRFDLKSTDSGSQYLSDLTLQNVPMSFTWGGEARTAKAVQLTTVPRRTGYLGIVLRYYENEILPESQGTTLASTSQFDNVPFAEISLLEDVAYFEWRVLDGRTMEWLFDWDLQGRLPLQLELIMAIGARGEEIRQVFWIPPKQNPEVLMRQMLQGAQVGQGGGGGDGADDDDDGPEAGNPEDGGGGRGGRGGRGGGGGGRGGRGGGGGGGPTASPPPPSSQ